MPCYQEPESSSVYESRRVANLIIILNKKLRKKTEDTIIKYSTASYEDHCEELTPILCGMIKKLSKDDKDKYIYNGKDANCRKLADWWDEHKLMDKKHRNENR